MISEELANFSKIFHEDILTESEVLGDSVDLVFVNQMGYLLEEYGETDTVTNCEFKAYGMRVDGFCYDDELHSLVLIISHYLNETELSKAKVSNIDINAKMNNVTNFFKQCLKGGYKKIKTSNEASDVAKLIHESRNKISKVKFILITDGISPKNPSIPEKINGIDVSRTVWDIERAFRFCSTGKKEVISINFTDYCNGPLNCVVMDNNESGYTTYLGYIPGEALADMYEKWNIKMLDMNVRVFLGANKKNKGIINTIVNKPEMFCAYNNGITVYSSAVTLTEGGDGLLTANDFQIINGGQTTASLYHARKDKKAGLGEISVQMKLTVIHDQDRVQEIVPSISEYSNTQNSVQLADLAANKPPHPEIHEISKRTPAPAQETGANETFWYYENTRGSFQEFKKLTAPGKKEQRKFDILWPRKQKFDKLKLGKIWNTFIKMPWKVCLGGQKNFSHFNAWLQDQEDDLQVFHRQSVSLVILWNNTERIVSKKKYPGYRHAIVTYTLSWFFHLTSNRIDLDKIWFNQSGAQIIFDVLTEMIPIVNVHIRDTEKSVDMYCREKNCWEKLLQEDFVPTDEIENEYYSDINQRYIAEVINMENEIDLCILKGGDKWFELSRWLRERNFLIGKKRSQCYNLGRIISRGDRPSEALSMAGVRIWSEAEVRGWNRIETLILNNLNDQRTIDVEN